jgi:hypothetical protein
MDGWRLMIFCARAAYGLGRVGRERRAALLACGTPTMKLWSFDALPESLHKHVVAPAAGAVHADLNACPFSIP